jgi:hypothetical protein
MTMSPATLQLTLKEYLEYLTHSLLFQEAFGTISVLSEPLGGLCNKVNSEIKVDFVQY